MFTASCLALSGCIEIGDFDIHLCPAIAWEGSSCDVVNDRGCFAQCQCTVTDPNSPTGVWRCEYPADLSVPDLASPRDLARPDDSGFSTSD